MRASSWSDTEEAVLSGRDAANICSTVALGEAESTKENPFSRVGVTQPSTCAWVNAAGTLAAFGIGAVVVQPATTLNTTDAKASLRVERRRLSDFRVSDTSRRVSPVARH